MYRVITGIARNIEDRLNDAVVLGPFGLTLPVGGLTVIFTTPAETATFAGSGGSNVPLKDVVATLTAITGINVRTRSLQNGQWDIVIESNTTFTIGTAGTANTALGLSASVAKVSTPVTASNILAVSGGDAEGNLVVVLNGAT
jgi:nitrate reductase NapAB chaperone NapD